MKVLTDFDGTLTNIQHEYEFELQYIIRVLEEQCGIRREEFELLYETVWRYILQFPDSHGWYHNGRISAYCDEDLFMQAICVMNQLDEWRNDPPESIVGIMERMGSLSFMDIAEDAHAAMNLEPLEHSNTPEPQVAAAFQELLDRDFEIVVASNSPT